MTKVHLRPIDEQNLSDCLNVQGAESQTRFVATTAKSLAEAYVYRNLTPLAIYDGAARGHEQPDVPMVGFTMYEVSVGIGFIMRLLIDQVHQKQGYGYAAMVEVIRRLKLHPEVELIATSYRRENTVAAQLYAKLGFVPWDIAWSVDHPTEMYVRLPE